MNTRELFLHNLWRWAVGLPERAPMSFEEARRNWSDRFIELMRNRMILGAYRYGTIWAPVRRYKVLPSIRKRLDLYEDSGNLEHLVDVANLCMVEFVVGVHPKKHFRAGDDSNHTETHP